MQKTREYLILTAQAIFAVCLILLLVNFNRAQVDTKSLIGAKGDTAEVDYRSINTAIDQQVKTQIDALPKSKDGKDGQNGANGKDGTSVDYVVVDRIIQQKIQDAFDALEKPELPTLEIEHRNNPDNGLPEWRFAGDDSWQVCGDSCP